MRIRSYADAASQLNGTRESSFLRSWFFLHVIGMKLSENGPRTRLSLFGKYRFYGVPIKSVFASLARKSKLRFDAVRLVRNVKTSFYVSHSPNSSTSLATLANENRPKGSRASLPEGGLLSSVSCTSPFRETPPPKGLLPAQGRGYGNNEETHGQNAREREREPEKGFGEERVVHSVKVSRPGIVSRPRRHPRATRPGPCCAGVTTAQG